MPTTEEVLRWRDWFVSQDIPTLQKAQEQIKLGTISDICTCGCRSFKVTYGPDVALERVIEHKSEGPFCEVAFTSNSEEEINVMLWLNEHGMVGAVDIMLSSANIPWPDFNIFPDKLIGVWEIGP